ncbi:hypothetical protein [Clostridiisalibacter paucivorans]|uniref:hypothetical protein n=1 Tax=Clostridiisalibacter paucivorans TaxID=408753 RepID=UPI0004796E6B|nr:hypothetical protein [Clostridiisalibacter paucivorans]
MEKVCPLCNKIKDIEEMCPNCRTKMEDKGRIVDYLDAYSPYLSNEVTEKVDGAPNDKCVHLFQCPQCAEEKRVEIDKVEF